MTPDEEKLVRARQKSRALVFGLLLGALALLVYGISIAKIAINS